MSYDPEPGSSPEQQNDLTELLKEQIRLLKLILKQLTRITEVEEE